MARGPGLGPGEVSNARLYCDSDHYYYVVIYSLYTLSACRELPHKKIASWNSKRAKTVMKIHSTFDECYELL